MFVWLVEWPVSCRYWPCTIVRDFFKTPFHTKRATFSVFGGSLWRVFGSNTEENCTERSRFMYKKVLGWFGGVWLQLLHFVLGARAFCSCLPCGQRRRVFWHIKVSRRGQERVTSSQMVTAVRSCARGRAWLRLERDCAVMRSFKGSETLLRFSAFSSTHARLGRIQRALYADAGSSIALVALYWAMVVQVAS